MTNFEKISHLSVGNLIRAGDIVYAVNKTKKPMFECILILEKYHNRKIKGFVLTSDFISGRKGKTFTSFDFTVWSDYDFYLFPRKPHLSEVKVLSSYYKPSGLKEHKP